MMLLQYFLLGLVCAAIVQSIFRLPAKGVALIAIICGVIALFTMGLTVNQAIAHEAGLFVGAFAVLYFQRRG